MNKKFKFENMRKIFAYAVHDQMSRNEKIWLITGDMGYKMWDFVRADYLSRFINAGASEQAMLGIATGLALEGMIPLVYSITPFLLYRPFETIRNYINREKIPVKLIGSGRDTDYSLDGFSHWAQEDKEVMKLFPNIESRWPETADEIFDLVGQMIVSNKPWYINLKR